MVLVEGTFPAPGMALPPAAHWLREAPVGHVHPGGAWPVPVQGRIHGVLRGCGLFGPQQLRVLRAQGGDEPDLLFWGHLGVGIVVISAKSEQVLGVLLTFGG
jgi:hypothetical protein